MHGFRKNEPAVASETIDGEVVAINLDKGVYYSLQGTAARIWELIEEHHPIDAIVATMVGRYSGDDDEIGNAVRGFVAELIAEELISSDEQAASNAAGEAIPTTGERPHFERPVLSKYTDMQDLLLLDPIHEVDDTGWPNVKPGQDV